MLSVYSNQSPCVHDSCYKSILMHNNNNNNIFNLLGWDGMVGSTKYI